MSENNDRYVCIIYKIYIPHVEVGSLGYMHILVQRVCSEDSVHGSKYFGASRASRAKPPFILLPQNA